jgi:hypothetical protein
VEKPEKRKTSKMTKIILKWIIEKMGSVLGSVRLSCKHGNEPSGSVIFWKLLSRCTTGSFYRIPQLCGGISFS